MHFSCIDKEKNNKRGAFEFLYCHQIIMKIQVGCIGLYIDAVVRACFFFNPDV